MTNSSYVLPVEQLKANLKTKPNDLWLHQPTNGEWKSYTVAQVVDEASRVANALLNQGIEPGDRVAILAKNSYAWMAADVGMMLAGIIPVPIYSTASSDTIEYVIEHSGAKLCFVGKLDDCSAAEKSLTNIPVITFPDSNGNYQGAQSWQSILDSSAPLASYHTPKADDMATIVYTSGSTGKPKGVVLTHGNLGAAAVETKNRMVGGEELHRMMSYLPLAHITERSVVAMTSIYGKVELFFSEGLETFVEELHHCQPTDFISVPRLWAKFQAKVLAQIPDDQLQEMLAGEGGDAVAAAIRDKLGFGSCSTYGSGSAPISPALLEWFHRIGVDIAEGWGMTETSGLACSNQPFTVEGMGTIGTPLACNEMKLSDEGEVLIRGDAIFTEYYKNPEATAESFIDGWFRTGDKGVKDENGAYRITGRVKEQFKTAKGKYVAPVPIESRLATNSLIEQVCVLGAGRPAPMAIVVLNDQGLSKDQIKANLEQTLNETNEQLESHARLDRIAISETTWDVENDLLTPTMKLKRDKIEAFYSATINSEAESGVYWVYQ
ncbi:long-subunit acyl-CoA synthetase (AMP-forming) [Litorivivens lipolytica]|uniref:Long-subunit acyl-CoA synthetase (AMP-forming) n=1 Tax=Litorivivens lipolytica TaxID=1524264 RepID=A0A7W4W2P1_9GAMM|nr:AMP-binding protein [Litorivivens lipolytica]MBB3046342.1 long-subunit acyl-CoA synthetase (AMP-forming) [Litorivivens lipolytica]